jgi:hypothetical protein
MRGATASGPPSAPGPAEARFRRAPRSEPSRATSNTSWLAVTTAAAACWSRPRLCHRLALAPESCAGPEFAARVHPAPPGQRSSARTGWSDETTADLASLGRRLWRRRVEHGLVVLRRFDRRCGIHLPASPAASSWPCRRNRRLGGVPGRHDSGGAERTGRVPATRGPRSRYKSDLPRGIVSQEIRATRRPSSMRSSRRCRVVRW